MLFALIADPLEAYNYFLHFFLKLTFCRQLTYLFHILARSLYKCGLKPILI